VTDTGFVFINGKGEPAFMVANFKNEGRWGEEVRISEFMKQSGHKIYNLPASSGLTLEGGDVEKIPKKSIFLMGFGNGRYTRTTKQSVEMVAKLTGLTIIGLELIHDEFFHLDTCVFPFENKVLVVKNSLHKKSEELLGKLYGASNVIFLSEEMGRTFITNGRLLGDTWFVSSSVPEEKIAVIKQKIPDIFVKKMQVDEFQKGGGSIHCLTRPRYCFTSL